MIVFNSWKIENIGEFGYQYDNLSRLLLVHGAPDGYRWQMNIKAGENFDVLDLDQMDDGVGVVLTKEHLSITGYYELQLVGTLLSDGVTVRHTNVIRVFVPPSLSGDAHWPELPSEFSAAEQRIRELNSHPPIPGDNGYWLTWDLTVKAYVESEFPLPEGSGGSGGTTDHSKLSNREAIDQHPMSAITGLEAALEGKQPAGAYLTQETDPTVPDWAKAPEKPGYTATEVGADPAGTAAAQVAAHNTGTDAHSDIRLLIQGLTDRLNALADSDDATLDQLSEIVAYIKSNKSLIDAITTSKVGVADIVDDLTTNVANKPLSAAQGVALKALIDAITVPDKLPNPNALTFTGAVTGSYDGSVPVSVEIPSGGGSGSAENWRLVNTVTTSEDVSNIVVTQDSDGHAISLKKVSIFAKVRGNSSSLSAWCRITVNNLQNYFYSDLPNTFAATEGQDYYNRSRADFSVRSGRLMLDLLLRSLNNAASKNTLYLMANTGVFENYPDVVDAITSIRMWSGSAGIGAGTELMIYGIDA